MSLSDSIGEGCENEPRLPDTVIDVAPAELLSRLVPSSVGGARCAGAAPEGTPTGSL